MDVKLKTDRTMKPFIHMPQHFKSNRILPGHGRAARRTDTAIPGIDHTERQARRYGWTDRQANRRRAYGIGGSFGLIGALLALTLAVFAAMGPNVNVLDRPADSPVAQVSETAPLTTDAPVWRG